MQDHLRINRQILFDLASRYLEGLGGRLARLVYLAGLRNPANGTYAHPDLSLVYPAGAINEALTKCHEEIFESFLEISLAEQQRDFVQYLHSNRPAMPGDRMERRDLFASWMPPNSPEYLKELFLANLQALSGVDPERSSKAR